MCNTFLASLPLKFQEKFLLIFDVFRPREILVILNDIKLLS